MIDQWSLDALVARYELHPDLTDVFVEGEADQGLLQWFFEQTGRSDVVVYPITIVSIPPVVLDAFSLDHSSNRSKVICLALTLGESKAIPNVAACVADRDTEHIVPRKYPTPFLLFTDYTSMEMYAFKPAILQKLLRIVAPNAGLLGEDVMQRLVALLELLFSIRLANQILGFGLGWISFDRVMKLKGDSIEFDDKEFLTRYLNTRGKGGSRRRLEEEVQQIRSMFDGDCRRQIRGHDFVDVLTWYLRKRSPRACRMLTAEAVRQVLYAQLTTEDLGKETLFRSLLEIFPAPVSGSGKLPE
jgi:hypothetical protein